MEKRKQSSVLAMCLVLAALALPGLATAKPACKPSKNAAIAKKAFMTEFAKAGGELRQAYDKFVLDHKGAIEQAHAAFKPAAYANPIAQKWLSVFTLGQGPGTAGTDKDDAYDVCVDSYLAVVALPIDWKWHRDYAMFQVVVKVANEKRGARALLGEPILVPSPGL